MKNLHNIVAALALAAFVAPAFAADSPFANWTRKQLEVKLMQLAKENKELKAKLESGGSSTSSSSSASVGTAPGGGGDWVLDDFEAPNAKNNKGWWSGHDEHGMGTTLERSMVAGKSGQAMNLKGFFPKNEAPWPYATANVVLDANDGAADLTGFSALRFDIKGDGGSHRVQLERASVKDFAHPEYRFATGSDWKTVTIKLSDFAQPSWGAPVGGGLNDVGKIAFTPGVENSKYDFTIDNITFVK